MKICFLKNANNWLTGKPYDVETKEQIKYLMENDIDALRDSFYKNLEFGTGGMRGVMGVGTNRVNTYTLGCATQGLSNYLSTVFLNEQVSVAIAYDCRNNSKLFANKVADVFSANGIKVYIFDDLRPTPELSFAVRYLKCNAGIVITASHNPPEYNGYKVYWEDGGQIVTPHDSGIMDQIDKIQIDDVKFEPNPKLIQTIGKEIDEVFIRKSIESVPHVKNINRDQLKIVFTPIHGTSIKLIPQVLSQAGFKNVNIVQEQALPDGNFPTVSSPNPEEKEVLDMAMKLAKEKEADVLIGTDPDADRIGIAVKNIDGEMILLNGNQVATIMTYYLLEKWQSEGKIDGNQFIGSTIVTTPLLEDLARSFEVECSTVLTGFKWIAKRIFDLEGKKKFIGGGEESYGYMIGDFVRDKDAVTAALLVCQIAAELKEKQISVWDYLISTYIKYGFYQEHLISITKKGISGNQEIEKIMRDFRDYPPKHIDSSKVNIMEDYQRSVRTDMLSREEKIIDLPKSNVLVFKTQDSTRVALRPSGTEPKIKFYISVKQHLPNKESYRDIYQGNVEKINRIIRELNIS